LFGRELVVHHPPFPPAHGAHRDAHLRAAFAAQQHGDLHRRRALVGHPCPIIAINPEVDAIERLRHGDRLRRAECDARQFAVGAINELADVLAPKLLLAGECECRDGILRLDFPAVEILEVHQRRMRVGGAVGPHHLVGPFANGFLRGDGERHA